jgi:hypothetical protein
LGGVQRCGSEIKSVFSIHNVLQSKLYGGFKAARYAHTHMTGNTLYTNFAYIYLIWFNFLQFLLKINIFFKVKSLKKIAKYNRGFKTILYYFKKRCFQIRLFKLNGGDKNRFILAAITTFFFKDLNFIVDWIVNYFESINLKLHKRLFLSLKLFYKQFYKILSKWTGVRGFSLTLRGKISATGSSKKRIMGFAIGVSTNTTKSIIKEKKYALIRTTTGVLGLSVVLLF